MMTFANLRLIILLFATLMLTSCFQPPYNHFRKDWPIFRDTAKGAIPGELVGAAAGGVVTGTAIGAGAGAAISLMKDTPKATIKQLACYDIQYVEYGDRRTLIVPTDRYFYFNTAHLNDTEYKGLYHIAKMLSFFPRSSVFVAGFTDNVGTARHKYNLSMARAQAMVTYLWAFNIPSHQIKGQGFGDKFDIGDNKIIHGSAYNRRLEIQWSTSPALLHER